jgi:hypothetical protein
LGAAVYESLRIRIIGRILPSNPYPENTAWAFLPDACRSCDFAGTIHAGLYIVNLKPHPERDCSVEISDRFCICTN